MPRRQDSAGLYQNIKRQHVRIKVRRSTLGRGHVTAVCKGPCSKSVVAVCGMRSDKTSLQPHKQHPASLIKSRGQRYGTSYVQTSTSSTTTMTHFQPKAYTTIRNHILSSTKNFPHVRGQAKHVAVRNHILSSIRKFSTCQGTRKTHHC
jgi:hypothetical protein